MYKKTRHFGGKRGIFNRDGHRSGTGLSENLRQGRRRERRSFFMSWRAPERAQDAGALLDVSEPIEAEKREQRPFLDKGGPLHPSRKSQQQTQEDGLRGPRSDYSRTARQKQGGELCGQGVKTCRN